MNQVNEQIAEVGASATKIGASVSGVSGALGWLTNYADAIAAGGVIVGIIIGVAGFWVNYHFKKRNDDRAQRLFDLQIKQAMAAKEWHTDKQ